MSELIAAAIGAGGALSGVVVAGAFTLAQARRNSADRELDRLEQRRSAAREARREVYAQMVSILRRASAAHESIWRANPMDLRQEGNDAFSRARSLEDDIEHAANLVMLAGLRTWVTMQTRSSTITTIWSVPQKALFTRNRMQLRRCST